MGNVGQHHGHSFCVAALEEALGKGRPEIFNTDHGSQFTSEAFTQTLQEQRVQVSMDGKGRYLDNIFVERLWRSMSSTTGRGLTRLWATGP